MQPDAQRRPTVERGGAEMSLAGDTTIVATGYRTVTVADVEQMPDDPAPGRPVTADAAMLALVGAIFGPHAVELIRAGALEVRRDDRATYFRPAGWEQMTPDEQTVRVVSMLNGTPTREAA